MNRIELPFQGLTPHNSIKLCKTILFLVIKTGPRQAVTACVMFWAPEVLKLVFLCPVNLIRGVVEGKGFVGPV